MVEHSRHLAKNQRGIPKFSRFSLKASDIVFQTFEDAKIKKTLCGKLRLWFEAVRNSFTNDIPEKYIELAYHVVRKNWKMLKENPDDAIPFMKAVVEINIKVDPIENTVVVCF